MRYLFGFLCVCALGVVPHFGCSGNANSGPYGGCWAPLSDYCEGSDCPTWDQAVLDAGWGTDTGVCGDFQYVNTRFGYGDFRVLHFDDSGTLTAAETTSDAGASPCDFMRLYGPVPNCKSAWWRPWSVCNLCSNACSSGLDIQCGECSCDWDGAPGVCVDGACEKNACEGVVCNDDNQCTRDWCDHGGGTCVFSPRCLGGPCTDGHCDPANDMCSFTPATDGRSCAVGSSMGSCGDGECVVGSF